MFGIFGYIFIGIGIFLTITTMLGFARFDNIYTRIHIGTMNDMLGIPFAIVGVACLFANVNDYQSAVKLLFAVILWYIIAPITSYIIIKIAYFYKQDDDNVEIPQK